MKKLAVVFFLFFSVLTANASSQWMWHGAFPWVYSYAESSWWYMKAGTDGKFLAWKQGDKKWYSFDEVGKAWVVLPGQEDQQVPTVNEAGDTYTVQGAANLEMIWVEPGTFTMGSPITESGRMQHVEKPHQVTLTQGFWLGKYEVTQPQYEAVMTGNTDGLSATPSGFRGSPDWPVGIRPVEMVSWDDAQVFFSRLNAAEEAAGRLPAGWEYGLPTEAQWEYACRAGTTTAYSSGLQLGGAFANYAYNGWGTGLQRTSDVGRRIANPWGFFDMHGNVWEWTADWYDDYPTGAVTDPVGPVDGLYGRVPRGGSWYDDDDDLRSARRADFPPGLRFSYLGFRTGLRFTGQ